jgi:hypothetical protein
MYGRVTKKQQMKKGREERAERRGELQLRISRASFLGFQTLEPDLFLGREGGDRLGKVLGLKHDRVPEGGVVEAFLDAGERNEKRRVRRPSRRRNKDKKRLTCGRERLEGPG